MAKMRFAQKNETESTEKPGKHYKVLVVDDDESIHAITDITLGGMDFSDFQIEILSAYSAKEAKEILQQHDDIALALVDVVMETPEAGLELVNYIRNDLQNKLTRLVIRTGQANNFPQVEVTKQYDINDFKEKTELNFERLFITVRTSIKQYEYIAKLHKINQDLDARVNEEVEKNRKKDKIMLQQSKLAQMGEMISMIAHQWRQPLSSISTVTANIQTKFELGLFDFDNQESAQKAQKYFLDKLGHISSYVDDLSKTIDDFRNFYKPNKKKVFRTFEDITKESLKIIGASLKSKNIELIQQYDSVEELELYDRELMQVVLNLLKNAEDNFREKEIEDRKIYIRSYDRELSICDNGGGIPVEIFDKIFDPYFSTKSEKNGTGLGLYMSKIIVEEHHNGSLVVTNENNGACFTIRL